MPSKMLASIWPSFRRCTNIFRALRSCCADAQVSAAAATPPRFSLLSSEAPPRPLPPEVALRWPSPNRRYDGRSSRPTIDCIFSHFGTSSYFRSFCTVACFGKKVRVISDDILIISCVSFKIKNDGYSAHDIDVSHLFLFCLLTPPRSAAAAWLTHFANFPSACCRHAIDAHAALFSREFRLPKFRFDKSRAASD